jgi:hypothetical protein
LGPEDREPEREPDDDDLPPEDLPPDDREPRDVSEPDDTIDILGSMSFGSMSLVQ